MKNAYATAFYKKNKLHCCK